MALERANLTMSPKEYLTLCQYLDQIKESIESSKEEPIKYSTAVQAKRDKDKARCTWFCVSYSKIWGVLISKLIT